MSKILVVEDEIQLANSLFRTLNENNFTITLCGTYADLENEIDLSLNYYDAIILDRLLHGKDSANLIEKIRKNNPDIKIIVLSAINTSLEKAHLLDLGADDYLSKPFDYSELIARLKVTLRRYKINLGNLTLNIERRTIKVAESEVALQNKEYILLKTLLQNPRKIFNKSFLYDEIWGVSPNVDSNVIEMTVNKLRHRLKEMGATVVIKNSRNLGYWLEE